MVAETFWDSTLRLSSGEKSHSNEFSHESRNTFQLIAKEVYLYHFPPGWHFVSQNGTWKKLSEIWLGRLSMKHTWQPWKIEIQFSQNWGLQKSCASQERCSLMKYTFFIFWTFLMPSLIKSRKLENMFEKSQNLSATLYFSLFLGLQCNIAQWVNHKW